MYAPTGEEAETIASWPWEDTRPASSRRQGDDDWDAQTIETIREHAESVGHGAHRYHVVTYDADGVSRAMSWCRVTIRRPRQTSQETADDLDGSVSAWVTMMQQAYADERKARIAAMDMLSGMFERNMRVMDALAQRVETTIRSDDAERRALEEEVEVLRSRAQETEAKSAEDDPFRAMIALVGPHVAGALAERLAPALEPLVESLASSVMGAASPEVATVDVTAETEVD